MKNNICRFAKTMCLCLLVSLSIEAQAQAYQSLSILGKEVTSANAADVLGDGGSVSYDAGTRTLTLRNADLPRDPYSAAIMSTYALRAIKLIGKNYLKNAIELYQAEGEDITICGNANTDCLFINSEQDGGILINGQYPSDGWTWYKHNITFRDCYVKINAAGYGLRGNRQMETSNSVILQNAFLYVSSTYASIDRFDRLSTSNRAGITHPEGAHFDKQLHAVTQNGKTSYMGAVIIDDRNNAASLRQNCFSIHQKDGMVVNYSFAEKPVVTYSGSDLVLTTSSVTVQYPLHSLRKMTIKGIGDATAINDVTLPDTEFSFSDEDANVRGEKPGTPFYVFDIKGMKSAEGTIDAEGKANIRLSSLSSGIYIVKTQSTSFKIKK